MRIMVVSIFFVCLVVNVSVTYHYDAGASPFWIIPPAKNDKN